MDKYEYQVCIDQIKSLIKERHFAEAMDIADTIDWRRVKSFSMLCTVSEIYKVNKHYNEAKEILLLAYERYPDRANVVYALCELAIKLDETEESIEYYKEYVRLKPHDHNRYVLLYKIYEAQEVPLEERISLLEEFKREEYTEKWAYELATLYHKDGQETKCVETCNELALWFGDGVYVRKALELKMQHAPLTIEQQRKYDGVYDAPFIPKNDNEEQVHIYETQSMNAYANGASPFETAPLEQPEMKTSAQSETESARYQGNVHPDVNTQGGQYSDINVPPLSTDKYSTINLQEELARNMEEFYSSQKDEVAAPYYGSTSQLYEPSQAQFMNQINQAGAVQESQGNVQPQYVEQPQMNIQPQVNAQAQYMEQPQMNIQPQVNAQPQYAEQPQMNVQPQYVEQSQVSMQPQVNEQLQYVQQEANVQPQIEEPVQPQEIVLPVYEEKVVANTGNIGPIQMPQPGTAGVPKELEDQLREGLDGQVTMALPDAKEIERQITGQIDISDFMKDWEAKKKAGQEQRQAQIKAKGIEQTNDIMAQLIGVIPGIENGAESFAPTHRASADIIQPEYPVQPVEEVLRDDEKAVITKTTMSSPNYDRDSGVKRTESGAIINGPMVSSVTGEIPNILPSADMMEKGDVLPSGRRLTLDEQYGGNIASIRQEDADLVKRMTGELPVEPVQESINSEPELAPQMDYGEAEELEEVEQPDVELEGDEQKDIDTRPVTGSIPPLNIPEEREEYKVHAPNESEIDAYEKNLEGESSKQEQPVSAADYIQNTEVDNAPNDESTTTYPYEVSDDLGEVEELVDLDQPEEVDDMLKTRPLPIDEIEARQRYEAGIEEVPESEPKKSNLPSHMTSPKQYESRRPFEDVEIQLFGRFEGIDSLQAQIVDVVDYMSMDPRHGNVVVCGKEYFGRKEIAYNIVKAMQVFDKKFLGKVAKISGEALNKKNIPSTLAKLKNGALIVENAGGLSPITINSITESLLSSDEPIMVVFEGEKDSIEPLLNGCPETRTVFDARIVIDDFSDDDLVSYARGYARELEYSIDEMGTLALHTKIADMQTYDHAVSVQEVAEIVDDAIRHVDRKNMSHFMDVLVGKRYDADDFIVLREKDFMQ